MCYSCTALHVTKQDLRCSFRFSTPFSGFLDSQQRCHSRSFRATIQGDSALSFQVPAPPFGSFVLHLLVGFWWDQVWNRWDGSQLLPSQTPTNHSSWIFWLILTSVPKRKFNKHKIATISSHQNPTKSLYVLSFSFPFHLWKVGFGWDEWLVTCVEKWKLTKTNDDWTL